LRLKRTPLSSLLNVVAAEATTTVADLGHEHIEAPHPHRQRPRGRTRWHRGMLRHQPFIVTDRPLRVGALSRLHPGQPSGDWQRDDISVRGRIVPGLGARPVGSLTPGAC
jgi:hypothetical protein